MDIIIEKWDEILYTVKLEHELSDVSFNTWIKPLKVHSIENSTIIILVPSEQMGLNYISKKYTLPIKVAVAEITGLDYNIEFILPEQAKTIEKSMPPASTLNENLEKANLNPKYTFDTFVVGKP